MVQKSKVMHAIEAGDEPIFGTLGIVMNLIQGSH